ncbi:MAG: Hsp20/alpha crystallin family protein [Hyphomicrobiaceae bacterium]
MIDINVELPRKFHLLSNTIEFGLEEVMVEKSHTAGSWPHLYEPLRGLGRKVADWFAPRSEASAVADCYEIKVELPGVTAEDIDVSVHDNSLTVRGEKQFEREETGRDFFFSEREYGAFQRTFRLPPDAAADKIDAEHKDGVLILKIAKQKPTEPAAKKVAIRQG